VLVVRLVADGGREPLERGLLRRASVDKHDVRLAPSTTLLLS
jgi:hypothetical protein